MSLTVPFRSHRHLPADQDRAATEPAAHGEGRAAPVPAAHSGAMIPSPASSEEFDRDVAEAVRRPRVEASSPVEAVRIGAIRFRSAAAYLLLWTVVLFAVQVLVFWAAYATLHRLGVLDSASEAAATVLGDPVPASGVLPALELSALLPWALLVAGLLSVLALIASLAVLLAHNCICAITGGPQVRVALVTGGGAARSRSEATTAQLSH